MMILGEKVAIFGTTFQVRIVCVHLLIHLCLSHGFNFFLAGNDAGNFGINWKVGSLRLLRKLVRTSEHNLNLTITATDGFTVVNMMVILKVTLKW